MRSTGENFNLAWKTLSQRYDNPQLRFSTQMDLLLKMPAATEESVNHLTSLLVSTNESINIFKSLNRPVNHWDDILVY